MKPKKIRRPLVILPYKIGSSSARNLAAAMTEKVNYRVRRLFNDRPNPTFVAHPWTRLINWGNGRPPVGLDTVGNISNSFAAVAVASNKLSTFRALENKDGIHIPEFTTDRAVAEDWTNHRGAVVCRTKLSGHSGDGIVIATTEPQIVDAPLYVLYVKKQKEFRVHVCFGEVIDVQEKRKRKDLPEDFSTNFQVRNHQTGWVYCRENIVEPDGLRELALAATKEMALQFSAVDIIWNEKRNECYCLELNTAPGLEGQTVEKYAEVFVRKLQ